MLTQGPESSCWYYREALVTTLKYNPFLIKPNNHELEELFNVSINGKEELIEYGQRLREMGAENVVISMAGEGALLLCKEGVYHASAPKGIVKNSVGAGDSLIAGFIASYSQNSNLIESLKWGAATGSATAFSMDLCEKQDVERFLTEISITKLV